MTVFSSQTSRPQFTDVRKVRITDAFFAPYIGKIRSVTVKDVFSKFIKDGAIENYERVARHDKGGHAGHPWYHGLICEVIRGVSDLIAVNYDAGIDAEFDKIIDSIRRALDVDTEGWLHPYDTLMCPNSRFGLNGGNARYQHETYDTGCLIEAGVHHYQATGKTTLLEAAVRNANYFTAHIGEPPKWNIQCEHSMIETALISLEQLFDAEPELADKVGAQRGEYLKLAQFFLEHKGDNETRHQYPKFLQEYAQDHRPAREQREAVGHAVRATLFYTALADAAMALDDDGFAHAAQAIWDDIAETKVQINGSIGARRDDERFGHQYELPNNAYLETCAGVGLMFFGASLYRLTRNAAIWDVVESTIVNLLPAAVSADGCHYTYENPLESRGNFERWAWHGCPCCPPMLLKAVGVMPSYFFARQEDKIWMNLYIDAEVEYDDAKLSLVSIANGKKLTIDSQTSGQMLIRIPEWAEEFALKRNGAAIEYAVNNGYAVVAYAQGVIEISIEYKTPAVKIMAHPWVAADRGRVAVKVGPVLYCHEKQAKDWVAEMDKVLSTDAPQVNGNGTVTVKTTAGEQLELIEYRQWNNHGPLSMIVWFRQEGFHSDPSIQDGWEHKLYRKL